MSSVQGLEMERYNSLLIIFSPLSSELSNNFDTRASVI